ncbi:Histidine kinase-, DNA gyrase B-, and HSP90-like ATPase [Winogradskyella thalassocola]|uniref:histidine kinase n=2 Tax=Winogradskyella thalassocola TaxID=262004 RepID=A0A1G8GV05_9FLAO|nr:Histidine kinase-, DNA gyrase B-, and HSP90-like ATPase [Winogradskyella thalassocola]
MSFLLLFLVNSTNLIAENSTISSKYSSVSEAHVTRDNTDQILIDRVVLAEQQLRVQKQNYQVYGGLCLIVILSVIAYLIYSQYQLKHYQSQKEKELKEALSKIEIQNKQQEQRLKISKDLHDTIGAQLTYIISSLDNLKYAFDIKDEKLKEKLNIISSFTSHTIYEFRDSIWAMTKNEITFLDLQARISNYIDQIKLNDSNIQFVFKVGDNVDSIIKFTTVEGFNIYSVIYEAIQNSIKHANASMIKVEVIKMVSNLVFKISDNGKGFSTTTVIRGNGLNTMMKRIQSIGGLVEINSIENAGTEIIITI